MNTIYQVFLFVTSVNKKGYDVWKQTPKKHFSIKLFTRDTPPPKKKNISMIKKSNRDPEFYVTIFNIYVLYTNM